VPVGRDHLVGDAGLFQVPEPEALLVTMSLVVSPSRRVISPSRRLCSRGD